MLIKNGDASGDVPTKVRKSAKFSVLRRALVELRGIEPLTSAVRLQRSPI